jgi:hypothetical protein
MNTHYNAGYSLQMLDLEKIIIGKREEENTPFL